MHVRWHSNLYERKTYQGKIHLPGFDTSHTLFRIFEASFWRLSNDDDVNT